MPRVRRAALRRKPESDALEDLLGDLKGGERAIRFFEKCLTLVKGEQAGKPLPLQPFQRRVITDLFGSVMPGGLRQYRQGLIMLPRKNAKSTLCAGIGAYLLFDGERGGEIVVAANSQKQAGKLFEIAANMCEASPYLSERSGRTHINWSQKQIKDRRSGSTFTAVSSDAGTNYEWDLTGWIYDELHAATDRLLYDALRMASGARRQPLGLVISTAGSDKESLLGELYEHSKAVQKEPSIDPHWYSFICEADPEDPWDDERVWEKANPGLDTIRSREEMRISANSARLKPSEIDPFRRFYLNVWTQAAESYIPIEAWDKCNAEIPEEELRGQACFGGLDLSASQDITAFELLFPIEDKIYRRGWAWLPEENIEDRENRAGVPFRLWARQGRLTLVPGPIIDPMWVVEEVKKLAEVYDIQRVTFDRWGSAGVYTALDNAGITMAQLGQGFASLSAPTKELLNVIVTGRLAHGGDPLLRWQAAACSATYDAAGNVKIVKPERNKHTRKVDSIVAIVMALDGLMRMEPASPSLFSGEPWWIKAS